MTALRYNRASVPTIAEYMNCDAFLRCLLGPFGSGKSSGCVWDIIKRGVRQAPGPDGVRRTRWIVVRNCFDDQTEILTEKRGWQPFRDLQPDDAVATLYDGRRLGFEVPSDHYSAEYDGQMIGLDNQGIDLLVTPDHKLWVTKTSGRDRRATPYRHETAENCYGMIDWRMKRDAEWGGGSDRYSLDFYEFLGFWYAEGYAGVYRYPDRIEPHRRFVLVQKTQCGYARDLLNRAGMKFTEGQVSNGCIQFRVSINDDTKPLVDELAAVGKAPEKYLLPWIKEATPQALRYFIRGYLMGDGIIRRHEHESTRAQTSSKRLADDIQEIALRCGYVVNILATMPKATEQRPNPRPHYYITFLTEGKYHPKTKSGWYRQNYTGNVYCVTVSSHVVYVRRNGRAVWCGQTFRQLEDTTIRTVHQWLPPYQFGQWRSGDHRYLLNAFRAADNEPAAEIELLFRALDRPDHVGNLLSMEATGAWVNEAREVPWAIIDALQGRVARYPAMRDGGPTWSGVGMDTNPPDVDSKLYKFFEEEDHSEAIAELIKAVPSIAETGFARIFKQPSGLSPQAENLPNLPHGYYQRLAVGKSDEWVKVYVHGQYGFVIDGKAVFPEYADGFHCWDGVTAKREPRTDPRLPIHRGYDFGLTPACVFTQLLPTGQWIIVDELVATSMGIDRFSDDVIAHSNVYYPGAQFVDIGDPAGANRSETDERSCFMIMRAKGIAIEPGIQTPTIRIESVRKMLRAQDGGHPLFYIHPRCKVLRRAMMGGYQYRRLQTSAERFTDKPDKNAWSHVADALCYVGSRLFGPGLIWSAPEDEAREPWGGTYDRTRSEVTGY